MKPVYIVAAMRTPMGSFGGKLSGFSAPELGSFAIKGALEQANVQPEEVNEVFYGNVISANLGQAPARQAALGADIGTEVPCTTVNKVCASGMKAAMFGAQSIQLGHNDLVVSGGMESMSNVPYYVPKARFGYKYGGGQLVDGLEQDGLQDAYDHEAMGVSGDKTAKKYNISREEQDEFAISSYKRAAEATESGKMSNEIIPVTIPQRKGDDVTMGEDEEYKRVKFEKIPKLPAVFSKDGTVTPANASTINDGAATLILASEEKVEELDLKPVAKIVSFGDAAQDPMWFTSSPSLAAEVALKRADMSVDAIDYFEVNEAFAVVALLFQQRMNLDSSKVNLYGGAVALGHPLGASGARILTTLNNVLHGEGGEYGLAAICNGGGGASAMIIQKV